ncbi:hypothetical protein VE02_09351 [Pseudogymnoascus sp. 03VT05]|nr:hypothetical protein VE02_09351 [Pseudogymnoascus sp. 03VT05]
MEDMLDHFRPFVDPSSKDNSTHFPLNREDLSKVSDEAILALYDTAPVIHRLGGTQVVRLSRTLVMKGGSTVYPCEAHAMILAREKTQIPLPNVHRIIAGEPDKGYYGDRCYIVMDYVEGEGRDVCWESLDAAKREDVAAQVAAMITEMERITLSVPGRGIWFSDYGTENFQTIEDMENWFNHKLDICNTYRQSLPNTPRFKFQTLVLTHQDIAPRNVILDAEGKAWLIDWAHAGAYPPGFERAALLTQCEYHFPQFGDEVCRKITPYPDVQMQHVSVTYGLTTAALA